MTQRVASLPRRRSILSGRIINVYEQDVNVEIDWVEFSREPQRGVDQFVEGHEGFGAGLGVTSPSLGFSQQI